MEKQNHIPALRFPGFQGEWSKKRLQNIAEKIQDGTHFSPKPLLIGDYLYITSKNVKNGYIELSNAEFISEQEHENIYKRCDVKKGDVLITKDGTIGQACVNELEQEFSLLSSVAFIRPLPEFSNYFIYQLLVSDIGQKEIESQIAGQALKRVTLTKINNFEFFFPTLPEQQKIASFFTAIDQKITLLKQQKSLLEQYKKGIMQKIFSQEIRFRDDDGKEFPEWDKVKFGDLYSFKPTNSLSREYLSYDFGMLKNIHYGDIHTKYPIGFDITKELVPFISETVSLSKYSNDCFCREGDLVIADASEDYLDVGKSIEIINLNQEKLVAGLHTILARPDLLRISIGFGGYLMKSETVRNQIMILAQGIKVLSISANRLASLSIELPSKTEQTKIANFLSALDEKIRIVQVKIEKTELWKKGLLQKMFC